MTTTTATSTTKEEVLEAVNKATLHTSAINPEDRRPWPNSKGDIVDYIATKRRGSRQHAEYQSRTSLARKHVTPGQVYKYLNILVSEGKIVAVPGSHWLARHGYAIRGDATYYFSLEAAALGETMERAKRREQYLAKARHDARETVLRTYSHEVEELVQAATDLYQEPTEASMLEGRL